MVLGTRLCAMAVQVTRYAKYTIYINNNIHTLWMYVKLFIWLTVVHIVSVDKKNVILCIWWNAFTLFVVHSPHTVHYCCCRSETCWFLQSSSLWEAKRALIGQLSCALWLAGYLKHVTEMLRPLRPKYTCFKKNNSTCCVVTRRPGLDAVHCSALTPRVLHALSVEESRRMFTHYLLSSSIHRCLVRIWPVWRKPHQHTPEQPGVCDLRLEDTCTNADGCHEWRWFQIGDVVFGFPTRSIAHHQINMQNKQYFPALKPANPKGNAVYGVWGHVWISIDL